MDTSRFRRMMIFAAVMVFIALLMSTCNPRVKADEVYTNEQIADAIWHAEGGAKTAHPYGILAKYKHTTPRKACLNTIKSARKRFAKQTKETDFVHFLGLTYCPIGCDTDNGTNRFWERNVKYWLRHNG